MIQQIYAEWKLLFISVFLVAFVASYIAAKRRYSTSLVRFIASALAGLFTSWAVAIAVGIFALGMETSESLAIVLGVFKFVGLVAVFVIPPVLVGLIAVLIGWWRGASRGRKLRAIEKVTS